MHSRTFKPGAETCAHFIDEVFKTEKKEDCHIRDECSKVEPKSLLAPQSAGLVPVA